MVQSRKLIGNSGVVLRDVDRFLKRKLGEGYILSADELRERVVQLSQLEAKVSVRKLRL